MIKCNRLCIRRSSKRRSYQKRALGVGKCIIRKIIQQLIYNPTWSVKRILSLGMFSYKMSIRTNFGHKYFQGKKMSIWYFYGKNFNGIPYIDLYIFWIKLLILKLDILQIHIIFCKMATFFHRSLALSMPIYRNFQSNIVKWRSCKFWKWKFI